MANNTGTSFWDARASRTPSRTSTEVEVAPVWVEVLIPARQTSASVLPDWEDPIWVVLMMDCRWVSFTLNRVERRLEARVDWWKEREGEW